MQANVRAWLRFIGSMNLAITLLVSVAIGSVIGTVLQQNQPYPDYIIKFGPFWHEVFRALALYDVYASTWFLCIMGFLVVSTSTCIARNGPRMVREARDFKTNVGEASLRAMRCSSEWQQSGPLAQITASIDSWLLQHGFRTRVGVVDGRASIAAMRGVMNRYAYLFTHVAIVIICVGGLVDGSLMLKLSHAFGNLAIETREIPLSQIPAASRLPRDNRSFRATVSIPESARVDAAFINVANGYVVQDLPFAVELVQFRVEHYPSGQPKSFESDLIIHDPDSGETLVETIAVNHPLQYRGYTIYQASFGDGGSKLELLAHPLGARSINALALNGAINDTIPLRGASGNLDLELTDFRRFNVNPLPKDDPSGRKFRDWGPSVTYRLRWPTGIAKEYVNYMYPVLKDGRQYFLSGTRDSPAEEFRYLHIPVDDDGSAGEFIRYQSLLNDAAIVEAAVVHALPELGTVLADKLESQPGLAAAFSRLVQLFLAGGYDAITEFVESAVPDGQRETAKQAYVKLLERILWEIYSTSLLTVADAGSSDFTPEQIQYFEEVVQAVAVLHLYGSPFLVEIVDFEHVEASGLQITRTPGKPIVYLGFALLICGVFLMLYIPNRRIWCHITDTPQGNQILLAGQQLRHPHDFSLEFRGFSEQISALLQQRAAQNWSTDP